MKKFILPILSLTFISAICAGVLAYINALTAEPIKATEAEKERRAVLAVLPPGASSVEAVAWEDAAREKPVAFVGRSAAGGVVGYAAKGADGAGYGGDIVLMVGFEADAKTVVCYEKLVASETPGLGMNLVSPEFKAQFAGKDGSALAVKKDGGEIEAITAATITSRAVCRAVADARRRIPAKK